MLEVVHAAARNLGADPRDYVRHGNVQVTLCAPERGTENPATELFRRHGLMGLRSPDKYVPDAIFGLHERQIARFLGVLFACDGYVHTSDRIQHAGFCTISPRLAKDVQHLLLRLDFFGVPLF